MAIETVVHDTCWHRVSDQRRIVDVKGQWPRTVTVPSIDMESDVPPIAGPMWQMKLEAMRPTRDDLWDAIRRRDARISELLAELRGKS